VDSIAQRITGARQVVDVAGDNRVGQWLQLPVPAPAVVVVAAADFLDQLQEPRPAVRSLERLRLRARQVRAFGGDRFGSEMLVEARRDRRALTDTGMQPPDACQQPMHVHAGVPVVAAEERRMQLARRPRIAAISPHVLRMVRVLANDVVERQRGKARGRGGIQRRFGHRRAPAKWMADRCDCRVGRTRRQARIHGRAAVVCLKARHADVRRDGRRCTYSSPAEPATSAND
jgi:hypothetical protein